MVDWIQDCHRYRRNKTYSCCVHIGVVLIILYHGFSSFPCWTNFAQPNVSTTSTPVITTDNDAAAIQKVDPNKRIEMSALVHRHTYSQTNTGGAVESKPQLIHPRKIIARPLRDKNIRNNMRLRPRQVLCTNCKQSIHDTVVNVRITNDDSKDQCTKENVKELPKQCSEILAESELKKRHHEPEDSVQSLLPRKKSHWSQLLKVSKTRAPVIKISFATPHGVGRVVSIPVKPSNGTTTDSESEPNAKSPLQSDRAQTAKYGQYKKWRKSMRKAKLKAKSSPIVAKDVPGTLERVPHHKKSKHGKHKAKRKHKHKDTAVDQTDSGVVVKSDLSLDTEIIENADDDSVGKYIGGDCWQDGSDDAMFVDSDQHYDEYSIMSNTDESSLKRKICKVHAPLDDGNSKGSFESSSHSHNSDDVVDLISDDESQNGALADSSDKEGDEREPLQPLMMRIHTCAVTACTTKEGSTFTIDDIVWGKIHGFPWWPGRICTMTVSKKDNGIVIAQLARVAWFGSSTVSHMPCAELCPFLRDFKLRYNKKKRGAYKLAIKQASVAAQGALSDAATDDIDFSIFED